MVQDERRHHMKTLGNKNKHSRTKNLSWIFVWIMCFVSCQMERNLGTDPAISPIIYPRDISYNTETGATDIQWEYLGIKPVSRFRLVRLERQGFHTLDWITPQLTREELPSADVWDMETAVDSSIHAGEFYNYLLNTEDISGKTAESGVGSIQIPGARLEGIDFDLAKSSATIQWHLPKGLPHQYELVRKTPPDLAVDVIFRTDNIGIKQFTEVLSEGNKTYEYVLRSFMDRNVILESRKYRFSPYIRRHNFDVNLPIPTTHFAITPSGALNNAVLMLMANQEEIAIQDLKPLGNAIPPTKLPISNPDHLVLSSLSIAVTPLGKPTLPLILLAGVVANTQQVQLMAFRQRNNEIESVTWDQEWLTTAHHPTTITVDSEGTIFVAVDQTLKLFVPEGDAIYEIGAFDLDISSTVENLWAVESGVWVRTNAGRVFRTPPLRDAIGGVSAPIWQEVILPEGTTPEGISSNQKGVFVLDGAQKRILTFNIQGVAGLSWQGLDDLDLQRGGLAVSPVGDVYVWDSQNRITFFAHPFSTLENSD